MRTVPQLRAALRQGLFNLSLAAAGGKDGDLRDAKNAVVELFDELIVGRHPSHDDVQQAVSDYLTTGDDAAIYCAFGSTPAGRAASSVEPETPRSEGRE